MKNFSLALILLVLPLFTGCYSWVQVKQIPLPADIMKKKQKIGIIWILDADAIEPFDESYINFMPLGGALLQRLTNKELIDFLKKQKISSFVNKYYTDLFYKAFTDEGFEVNIVDAPYMGEKFKKLNKKEILKGLPDDKMVTDPLNKLVATYQIFTYDLKPVAKELKVDLLLVLDIGFSHIVKKYIGGIPTGNPPQSWTKLRCYIVDGATNEKIAEHYAGQIVQIEEDWDESPDYPKVIKAASTSFEMAIDECFIGFFGRTP